VDDNTPASRKKMLDNLKTYIIEFTAYDSEPLHLLISASIEKRLCESANCVVQPILELLKDNYLECYHHSCKGGDKYKAVYNLDQAALEEYIKRNEKHNFENYPSPEEGGEYFFKTTFKGLRPINSDVKSYKELYRNKKTGETLERHVLERGGEPADKHPHYKEPDGW
jgi:hypothetical protein